MTYRSSRVWNNHLNLEWSRQSLYLKQQFQHFRVNQALDRFSVDMGDEVSGAQTCLERWAIFLHTLIEMQMWKVIKERYTISYITLFFCGQELGIETSVLKTCTDTHQHHVMHSIDVTVAHVDPDGLQGEAKFLPWGVDDDGRPQAAGAERKVSTGRRVTGRRIGGKRAWRDWTGLKATGRVICDRCSHRNSSDNK